MIPSIITDNSIIFFANGRPWTIAEDHARFSAIKELLQSGFDDAEALVHMADVRTAVEAATGGAAELSEEGLFLHGEKLAPAWAAEAVAHPEATRVLVAVAGDRVRVEGDEDAPDGIYTVGDVDNDDVKKRIYVESDEDYFGFVANASIKEIIRD